MKNYKFFLTALLPLLLFLLSSCTTSESAKDENNNNSPDSMKHSRAISPGTANIKASVVQLPDGKNHSYKIKVNEVTEYGAGTPVLPVGTEIQLYAEDTDENRKKLIPGENVFIHISYSKGMGEAKGYWTLINHLN